MAFPTSPVHENLFHRKAAAALDFLVVGGSIAGLAAAYNLRQAGHRVRVLEKGDGKYDVSESPPVVAFEGRGLTGVLDSNINDDDGDDGGDNDDGRNGD